MALNHKGGVRDESEQPTIDDFVLRRLKMDPFRKWLIS